MRAALPLLVAGLALAGCGASRPSTPYDHLYGEQWCRGIYAGYAERYEAVRRGSASAASSSYRVLARRGVAALERLQGRSTPFFVEIDQRGRFRIRRDVPERLTFTAEMSDEERELARRRFEETRRHLADDYTDVDTLESALNGLLDALGNLDAASSEIERERLNTASVRQRVRQGRLPFELPYQVTARQYDEVLLLLIDRLEVEKDGVERVRSGILAVLLAVRAADGSGRSLAANIEAAVLAATEDQRVVRERIPPPVLPEGGARVAGLERGEEIFAATIASESYQAFAESSGQSGPDPIGAVLSAVDSAYGTRLAGAAEQVRRIAKGESPDYFELLAGLSSVVPRSTAVGSLLDKAVRLTDRFRSTARKVEKIAGTVKRLGEAAESPPTLEEALGALEGVDIAGLANREVPLEKAYEQVLFIESEVERADVRGRLEQLGILGSQ